MNLTRFSLFFPEKREFFLEGQGIFAFGGVGSGNGTPGDVPVMFFSRQIGLSRGQQVPVIGGGRVTGRAGHYSIGALNIETGEKPSAGAVTTNFTAVRVKRDILRRSNFGVVATHRSAAVGGSGANSLLGMDGNLFLFTNLTANLYYTRTTTDGSSIGSASYRGAVDYSHDRYGFSAEHLLVGQGFDPQVGYARRLDFRRSFGEFRFTPRPRNRTVIRKFTYLGSMDYVTDARARVVMNKELRGQFGIALQNSDQFEVEVQRPVRAAAAPLRDRSGGDRACRPVRLPQRQDQLLARTTARGLGTRVRGYGTLYGGTRTETTYSGRVGIVPQFAVEPALTLNWVELPYGSFRAQIVSSRFIVTPTPRMMITSLWQLNATTKTLTSSVRLRWSTVRAANSSSCTATGGARWPPRQSPAC